MHKYTRYSFKLITTHAELHEAGHQIYLIATEAHGITRGKVF